MPSYKKSRIFNCGQQQGSTQGQNCVHLWYRWLQLLVGTAVCLGFAFYGWYVKSLYELPLSVACFFVSGLAFISAIPPFIKLLRGNGIKRRNNVSAGFDATERNLQSSVDDTVISNGVSDSITTDEEIENLRKMLSLVLSSPYDRTKSKAGHKRPPPFQQAGHHIRVSPYGHTEKWMNLQRNVHKFSSRNKLNRIKSYESSLNFHRSYLSDAHSSIWNENFLSSSSDIYCSSSDEINSSVYGWKKNFGQPRTFPTMTDPKITTHNVEKFEVFRSNGSQFNKALPILLPEQFPALPFPKRNYGFEKRHHCLKGQKRLTRRKEKELLIVTSLAKSKSMININLCKSMS